MSGKTGTAQLVDVAAPATTRPNKVVNIEITSNIGNHRQIRMMTDYPVDADPEEAARTLDTLSFQCDRQRARYELEELEEELDKRQDDLAVTEADLSECRRVFNIGKAARKEALSVARAKHVTAYNQERSNFDDKGGQRVFDDQAVRVRSALRPFVEAVAAAEEAESKAAAEHEANVKNYMTNIEQQTRYLGKLEAKIEKKRKLVG